MAKQKSTQTVTVSWATRKRLALNAFTAMLVYTLLYWFALPIAFTYFGVSAIWLTAIQDSYSWFAITMASVILGYMGFTTLPFIGKGGKGVPQYDSSTSNDIEDDDKMEPDGEVETTTTTDSYVDPNYKFNSKDM